MQKPVNPWVALIIILVFGGLLGGYVWAGQKWIGLERLGLAKPVFGSHLAFQFGQRLLIVDDQGQVINNLNFSQLQEKNSVGDFAFFKNGDLLLALNQQSMSLEVRMQIMARVTNQDTKSAGANDAALFRCKLEPLACARFSEELPGMNRTFRLFIDDKDNVHIADTSRHQLLLLNSQGEILAKKEGFLFPNHIHLTETGLILADTNHHQIKILDPDPEFYGMLRQVFDVRLPYKTSPGLTNLWAKVVGNRHIWPIDFVVMDNSYWVVVGDDKLAYGRIAIFNNEGAFIRELPLEEGADPISIVRLKDRVLIFDMANYKINQFDNNANRLDDFMIPELLPELSLLQQRTTYLTTIQSICVWAFVIFLGLGFAVAIPLHLREQKKENVRIQTIIENPDYPQEEIWLTPSDKVKRFFRRTFFVFGVCGLMVIVGIPFVNTFNDEIIIMLSIFIIFYVICIVGYFTLMRSVMGQKLGILSDKLVLISADSTKYESPYSQIWWTDNQLMIQEKMVVINAAQRNMIFDYEVILRHILPRLDKTKKLSGLAMFMRQLSLSPMHRMTFIAVIALLIISIVIDVTLKN